MSDQKPKSLGINFETVASIVAMIIGISALFVAWDQSQILRKQQHASVWPVIEGELSFERDELFLSVRISLRNVGIGPARIESVGMIVDGNQIATPEEFQKAILPESLQGNYTTRGSTVEGNLIAPGDKITILQLSWPRDDKVSLEMQKFGLYLASLNGPDLTLGVCYCSVFDRCWEIAENDRPTRIKSCSAPTGLVENFFSTASINISQTEEKQLKETEK